MASSSSVNHPEVLGQPITSSCVSGGRRSDGMIHSFGIEARSAALFLAVTCSHVFPCEVAVLGADILGL